MILIYSRLHMPPILYQNIITYHSPSYTITNTPLQCTPSPIRSSHQHNHQS